MIPHSIKNHIPTERLTPREIEVITLTARGKRRGEISAALSLSEETVKGYIERVCRKLNASNKTHASIIAFTLGLIRPYQPLGSSEYIDNQEKNDDIPQTGDA